MNTIRIAGIALIVAGILALAYGGFSYNKETVGAKLGPIELKVTEKKTINVPMWAGIGAIVAGGVLLVMGGRKSSASPRMATTPDSEREPTPSEKRVLLMLLAAVSVALAWILLPFYGTILWGTVIALLFAPLHRRLLPRLAQRRTPAALADAAGGAGCGGAAVGADRCRAGSRGQRRVRAAAVGRAESDALFPRLVRRAARLGHGLLDRFGLVDFNTLQRRLTAALAQGSQVIATQALGHRPEHLRVHRRSVHHAVPGVLPDPRRRRLARALRHAVPLAPAHAGTGREVRHGDPRHGQGQPAGGRDAGPAGRPGVLVSRRQAGPAVGAC